MDFAPNLSILYLSQIVIGIGSAGTFLLVCKIIKNWFEEKNFNIMVGITATIGVLGMIAGKFITSYLLETGDALLLFTFFNHHWQNILCHYAVFGIFLLLLMILFIKNDKNPSFKNKEKSWDYSIFKKIILSPTVLSIALLGALLAGPFTIFTAFSKSIFTTLYSINTLKAASLISLLFLGYATINPLLTFLGAKYSNHYMSMVCIILMFITTYYIINGVFPAESYSLKFVIFMLGAATACDVLILAIIAKSVPKAYSATAISIAQFVSMGIGATIYPILFGHMLETNYFARKGHTMALHTTYQYAKTDYIYAFKVLFAGYTIAIIGFLIITYRKKFTKQNL